MPNVVLDWAEKLIPFVFIPLGLFVFIYCYLSMKKSTLFIIALVGISLLSKEAIFIIAVLYLLYCKNFTQRTWLLLMPLFTMLFIGIA
jgi:hypothetical protein